VSPFRLISLQLGILWQRDRTKSKQSLIVPRPTVVIGAGAYIDCIVIRRLVVIDGYIDRCDDWREVSVDVASVGDVSLY